LTSRRTLPRSVALPVPTICPAPAGTTPTAEMRVLFALTVTFCAASDTLIGLLPVTARNR